MLTVPVMRPKLPSAPRLVPYLDAIDSSRIYSNFGPLVRSFEDRLAERYDLAAGGVTTVANATLGLTLALAAQGARPGTLCLMPAWTFIASAHAATMAGLVPYFVDVDADIWAVDAEAMADLIRNAPGPVGAVMSVAPFGRPIDVSVWDDFRTRTGIPVVIDAAAAFDGIVPGQVPVAVSLHATKVLGVGEGGFVMSADDAIIRDIQTRSNFGFHGSREAAMPAANAKLSEYHAAVGLAGLDEWAETRSEWIAVAQAYQGALTGSNLLRFQDGFGDGWITSTCVIDLGAPIATRLEDALAEAGIQTRRWWGSGAHAHPATASSPRTALPVTEMLANSTIALPFYRDLEAGQIRRIAEIASAAIMPATGGGSGPVSG